MKKFDILRYLRRFFALVLAVTMAGTVVVYWYCKNNQTYTASVNIKYLHDGIKDGFAPGRHRHERGRDLFFQGHLAGHGEPWAAKAASTLCAPTARWKS